MSRAETVLHYERSLCPADAWDFRYLGQDCVGERGNIVGLDFRHNVKPSRNRIGRLDTRTAAYPANFPGYVLSLSGIRIHEDVSSYWHETTG